MALSMSLTVCVKCTIRVMSGLPLQANLTRNSRRLPTVAQRQSLGGRGGGALTGGMLACPKRQGSGGGALTGGMLACPKRQGSGGGALTGGMFACPKRQGSDLDRMSTGNAMRCLMRIRAVDRAGNQ
jgi:hypothetical protein